MGERGGIWEVAMIGKQGHCDAWPAKRPRERCRSPRVLLPTVALLTFLACLLTVVSWLVPGVPATVRADTTSGAQKIAAFEDVTVGPDESWDNVVVFAGDVVIEGTVRNVVVVVSGDLRVGPRARIGSGGSSDDPAVISLFGEVAIESGATISGRTVDVAAGFSSAVDAAVVDPVLRPWRLGSVVGWIATTMFLAIVAAIAVAIAPRQVGFVRDRVRNHAFSSLGLGALGAIVAVPVISVLLIVTVVGILVVIPWLVIALPFMSLFGLVAVGAAVGGLIIGGRREDTRGRLSAAAVVGVVVISLVRWIPVGGAILLGLLWLTGFGATFVAIWDWRRRLRRSREAPRGPADGHDAAVDSPIGPGSNSGGPGAGQDAGRQGEHKGD